MNTLCNCCYDWQNTSDLSDLVSSGRDRKPEEVAFTEDCELKSLAFRAERFFFSFLFWLTAVHKCYVLGIASVFVFSH